MSEGRKTRILVADDHLVVRMGLSTLIEAEPDMEVVGEAADGREAVDMAMALRPDIVIMDLMMPHGGGVKATARIHSALPDTKVMVLTTYSDSSDVKNALQAGATSALIKDAGHDILVDAIHKTALGERVISPEMRKASAMPSPVESLSPRNMEILGYVAKGFNNKEIAELLHISRDNVKFHLKVIFSRLGAASRTEAVAIALSSKLLSP